MLRRYIKSLNTGARVSIAIISLILCLGIVLVSGIYVVRVVQRYTYLAELIKANPSIGEELQVAVVRFQWISRIALLIGVGLALYALWLVYRRHTQPLQETVRLLDHMSQGDLSQRLPTDWSHGAGDLARGVNYMADRMESFIQLNGKMATCASFTDVFDFIYDSFEQFLPYDRMGVALINCEERTIRAERARSRLPIKLYNGYTLPLDETSLPQVIQEGKPRIIADLEEYLREHPESESTRYIVEEGIRSSITLPLTVDGRPLGALFFSSRIPNVYDWRHVEFLELAASCIAPSLERSILIGNLILSSAMGFARLAAFRDTETGEHLQRMRRYAATLANAMATRAPYDEEIDDAFIQDIYNFSPLHDIGKVGIPDRVLLKPGRLTKDEFEIMKQHTIIGAEALREAEAEACRLSHPLFGRAINIAAYHHERYDGTGYPEGLSGTEIPLCARIVAVADVFDALTSPRRYKSVYSFERAVEIVVAGSGTHFEPGIVDCFCSSLDEFRLIYDTYKDPMPGSGGAV